MIPSKMNAKIRSLVAGIKLLKLKESIVCKTVLSRFSSRSYLSLSIMSERKRRRWIDNVYSIYGKMYFLVNFHSP
jgi:hypothetical protein